MKDNIFTKENADDCKTLCVACDKVELTKDGYNVSMTLPKEAIEKVNKININGVEFVNNSVNEDPYADHEKNAGMTISEFLNAYPLRYVDTIHIVWVEEYLWINISSKKSCEKSLENPFTKDRVKKFLEELGEIAWKRIVDIQPGDFPDEGDLILELE